MISNDQGRNGRAFLLRAGRVPRIEPLRRIGLLALVAVLGLPPSGLHAQAPDTAALRAEQGVLNGKAGPRRVLARTVPLPADVDARTAALIARPYAPFWNWNPPSDAAWRTMLAQAARKALPHVAKDRIVLGVSIAPTSVGGVKAFTLTPAALPDAHRNQLVFQIHGGGYVFGAGEPGTGEAALMAAHGGYRVLAIDYRMPPDAPYPAALDDLVAAWRAVVKTTDPRRIAVEGTSTGGGLTLALMLRLKAEGLPLPGAIAPGAPWSDKTEAGGSDRTNEWVDNVLASYSGYLTHAAQLYAHGHDLKDPYLSPVYGDLHGLPPAILTAGTRDLFLSNTVRVHRKLREAGVEAELEVYEGLSHAQYAVDATAPVTKEAFGEMARFFDRHLAR